jgi:hypothetical protein
LPLWISIGKKRRDEFSIGAALENAHEIALGNVIGSNIANIGIDFLKIIYYPFYNIFP